MSVVAPGHAGTTRILRATERAAPRLRTVRLGTGRQLRGRVVDDHGAPLAGCRVTARHVFRWEHREARTDSAGRFTLPNLRGGYWLGVHAVGVASRTLRVRVGRWLPPLPVRIRLRRA